MLKGRESIRRLIGRRRRFLPNRNLILSSPAAQGSSSQDETADGFEPDPHQHQSGENGKGSDDRGAEWISCPVCGARVLGKDHVINSHLDKCLSKGKKRKLSQRTLLQLNFCSSSKVKLQANESETSKDQGRNDFTILDTVHGLGGIDVVENHDGAVCKVESTAICNTALDLDQFDDVKRHDDDSHSSYTSMLEGCTENQMNGDKINENCIYHSLIPENEMLIEDNVESFDSDDLSELSLDTYIVGRKFGEEIELKHGARILLSRDRENVKDLNAIKVLYTECGYDQTIGFLPRELAYHLSPLIEKFNLIFEGHVISVPTHPHAVVPVQITCQCNICFDETESNIINFLKCSWRNALRVAESAKAHPPGTAYQHNLQVLLKEVLKAYHHLFIDTEKTFLEGFLSLSDDSQRLFARLYTRKGPWFRMSSASYPEVSDCNEAVHGLSVGGYVTPVESISEATDVKEVLNVLNVGEIREILHMVNEVCHTHPQPPTHKQK
ncbi:unnamed protein product [Cuscuta campestris]|uniref:Fanconi-associated nuclease n=1 Tax=Cuscuta campestris TaxID=132261 RepID=A0A484MTL9_9ASTE|nr:unnamed protein product [Cuscuta campestris]